MSPLAFGIGKSRGSAFDSAVYYGDYLVFNYEWTDGSDLDTIMFFLNPTTGATGKIGERKGNKIENAAGTVTYAEFGGDNANNVQSPDGTIRQSVLIYLDNIKNNLTMTNNEFEIDLRAVWYAEVGTQPIYIGVDGYQGGTMATEASTPNHPGYGYINTTATTTWSDFKRTNGKITSYTNTDDDGARIARARVNFSTFDITFIEDD